MNGGVKLAQIIGADTAECNQRERAFAPSALTNVSVTASVAQSVVSSIVVMSFTGVDTSGTNGSGAIGAFASGNANPGAPTAQPVTTRNNSLVVGVGNDYDNAIGRIPGTAQSVVHQYFSPTGDTYWVQRRNVVTALSDPTVQINDTAPTGDRCNLFGSSRLDNVAPPGHVNVRDMRSVFQH